MLCQILSISCDQRLTASKVSTQQLQAHKPQYSVVINALRHQRLVHVCPQAIVVPERCVINALRHQRLVHDDTVDFTGVASSDQRLTASKVSTL